jgi:hypothetical protein
MARDDRTNDRADVRVNDGMNSIDRDDVEQDAARHAGRGASGSDTNAGSRDKYRDGDDMRDPLPPDQRVGTKSDSKSEARGDARENIGNTAHDQHRPGGAQGR